MIPGPAGGHANVGLTYEEERKPYRDVTFNSAVKLTVDGTGLAENRFINCKTVNCLFVSFSDTKYVSVQLIIEVPECRTNKLK